MECLRLWFKDLDFSQNLALIRDGKGQMDRTPVLLASLAEPLHQQIEYVPVVHENYLRDKFGRV